MAYYRPSRLLSEREEQVLALRADGYSGKEIGAMLGIAENTVFEYQHRAMVHFGVTTVRGAIRKFRVERFRRIHNVGKAVGTGLG